MIQQGHLLQASQLSALLGRDLHVSPSWPGYFQGMQFSTYAVNPPWQVRWPKQANICLLSPQRLQQRDFPRLVTAQLSLSKHIYSYGESIVENILKQYKN